MTSLKFPQHLKTHRSRLGLSMAGAVRLFPGLPYRTWQQWERAERIPPAYTQDLILRELSNRESKTMRLKK